MSLCRAASILALCAVTAVSAAQAPPSGSRQRSGYGGADTGSVGTTDDAGHSTVKTAQPTVKRGSHRRSVKQTRTSPKGFQSTNAAALNNNAKTTQTYTSHPPKH